MSRLLLDTTFLIDQERAPSAEVVIDDDDDVAIAAVTVAELRVGVLLADGRRRASREAFVHDVMEEIPVIAYDVEVAEAHADLLVAVRTQGRPRGAHDLLIAATARASSRKVITADPGGFIDLPGVDLGSHP